MTVGNILFEKEILLESGTNELEILAFELSGERFGINVAKVREVLPRIQPVLIPRSHPSLVGLFQLRRTIVPCISLKRHLNLSDTTSGEQTVIVADFSHSQIAFGVDRVDRIYRTSWENILEMPGVVSHTGTPVTAVARMEDKSLLVMLDFETISEQVTNRMKNQMKVANPQNVDRAGIRLALAEDSPTVRVKVTKLLKDSGYTDLKVFENGKAAWDWLSSTAAASPKELPSLVISDVEMPQIDGFHLTKKLKSTPATAHIPVVLYSSVVTPDNAKKGAAVGADAQISKPDLHRVVEMADRFTLHQSPNAAPVASQYGSTETPVTPTNVDSPQLTATTAPIPIPVAKPTVPPASPAVAKPAAIPTPANVKLAADELDLSPEVQQALKDELGDHARSLRIMLQLLAEAPADSSCQAAILRTLHTVKAAAAVTGIDALARGVHQLETTLGEAHGTDGTEWPLDDLQQLVNWMEELADPNADIAAALKAVPIA